MIVIKFLLVELHVGVYLRTCSSNLHQEVIKNTDSQTIPSFWYNPAVYHIAYSMHVAAVGRVAVGTVRFLSTVYVCTTVEQTYIYTAEYALKKFGFRD